jgi:hypothetical protein
MSAAAHRKVIGLDPLRSSKADQEQVHHSFGQVGVGLLQAAGQLSKQEHPHQLIYGQLDVMVAGNSPRSILDEARRRRWRGEVR